jgi:hypothetical protein
MSMVGGPLCVYSSVWRISRPNNEYWLCLGPTQYVSSFCYLRMGIGIDCGTSYAYNVVQIV